MLFLETNLHKSQIQIWQEWAGKIKNRNLQNIVATMLEAGGPLNTIFAQIVHISQPVMNVFVSDSHISAFADLLEEQEHTQNFIRSLREDYQ